MMYRWGGTVTLTNDSWAKQFDAGFVAKWLQSFGAPRHVQKVISDSELTGDEISSLSYRQWCTLATDLFKLSDKDTHLLWEHMADMAINQGSLIKVCDRIFEDSLSTGADRPSKEFQTIWEKCEENIQAAKDRAIVDVVGGSKATAAGKLDLKRKSLYMTRAASYRAKMKKSMGGKSGGDLTATLLSSASLSLSEMKQGLAVATALTRQSSNPSPSVSPVGSPIGSLSRKSFGISHSASTSGGSGLQRGHSMADLLSAALMAEWEESGEEEAKKERPGFIGKDDDERQKYLLCSWLIYFCIEQGCSNSFVRKILGCTDITHREMEDHSHLCCPNQAFIDLEMLVLMDSDDIDFLCRERAMSRSEKLVITRWVRHFRVTWNFKCLQMRNEFGVDRMYGHIHPDWFEEMTIAEREVRLEDMYYLNKGAYRRLNEMMMQWKLHFEKQMVEVLSDMTNIFDRDAFLVQQQLEFSGEVQYNGWDGDSSEEDSEQESKKKKKKKFKRKEIKQRTGYFEGVDSDNSEKYDSDEEKQKVKQAKERIRQSEIRIWKKRMTLLRLAAAVRKTKQREAHNAFKMSEWMLTEWTVKALTAEKNGKADRPAVIVDPMVAEKNRNGSSDASQRAEKKEQRRFRAARMQAELKAMKLVEIREPLETKKAGSQPGQMRRQQSVRQQPKMVRQESMAAVGSSKKNTAGAPESGLEGKSAAELFAQAKLLEEAAKRKQAEEDRRLGKVKKGPSAEETARLEREKKERERKEREERERKEEEARIAREAKEKAEAEAKAKREAEEAAAAAERERIRKEEEEQKEREAEELRKQKEAEEAEAKRKAEEAERKKRENELKSITRDDVEGGRHYFWDDKFSSTIVNVSRLGKRLLEKHEITSLVVTPAIMNRQVMNVAFQIKLPFVMIGIVSMEKHPLKKRPSMKTILSDLESEENYHQYTRYVRNHSIWNGKVYNEFFDKSADDYKFQCDDLDDRYAALEKGRCLLDTPRMFGDRWSDAIDKLNGGMDLPESTEREGWEMYGGLKVSVSVNMSVKPKERLFKFSCPGCTLIQMAIPPEWEGVGLFILPDDPAGYEAPIVIYK